MVVGKVFKKSLEQCQNTSTYRPHLLFFQGSPILPFIWSPNMISKSPHVHNAYPGDEVGGGGEKQSEEVTSVNLPNTFDSYSSYGSLILWKVYEWKGLRRCSGSFQTRWRGMENSYMIVELKSEITKYKYPCSCHFKRQWVEHFSYLSLSLHGI